MKDNLFPRMKVEIQVELSPAPSSVRLRHRGTQPLSTSSGKHLSNVSLEWGRKALVCSAPDVTAMCVLHVAARVKRE